MNPLKLARVALDAERLRLRRLASRLLTRIVLAVVAVIFALAFLVLVHVEAWLALRLLAHMDVFGATAVLGGVDLLIALTLYVFASRSTPSSVEVEALDVRRRAVAGLGNVSSMAQSAIPVLRMANSVRRRRRRV